MVVLSESTTSFDICSTRSNETNQITISQLCKHYITHIGIPVLLYYLLMLLLMLKNTYRSLPCGMHLIGNLFDCVLCVPLSCRHVCFYCVTVLHRNTESSAYIACFQICILLCHCFVYENFPIKQIKHTHIGCGLKNESASAKTTFKRWSQH